MHVSVLLIIDAIINYLLGLALLFFPLSLAQSLGVPIPGNLFYANILGAVLFGIGIALSLEIVKARTSLDGLGLAGAVSINLMGGTVLAWWLITGDLQLPYQGYVFLWALVFVLVGISLFELSAHLRSMRHIE